MTDLDDLEALAAKAKAALAARRAQDPEADAIIRASRPRWPRGRGGHWKWVRELRAETDALLRGSDSPDEGD